MQKAGKKKLAYAKKGYATATKAKKKIKKKR